MTIANTIIIKKSLMNKNCIFCKIINKQIPAEIIAQNENVLVIKDIAPKAPVHYLIIPKKHYADITQLPDDEKKLAADLLLMAKELSTHHPSFRLVSNNGKAAGQEVFHIHIHFLAGKSMTF